MSTTIRRKGSGNSSGTRKPNGVVGTAGTENYFVKDTPCLIPKQNMSFFNTMQQASQHSSFGNYPNPFDAFWKGDGH